MSTREITLTRSEAPLFHGRRALGSYLSDGIGGQDLVFHSGFAARLADYSKVPHCVAGRHSLPCARLPADDDGLILAVSVNGMSV